MKWTQHQANESGAGFVPISTEPARVASWTLQTGPLGFASPVLGQDGTIYIGTLDGQLFAVNPNGSKRWQKDLKTGYSNSKITASPAVDSLGNVYVIDTYARLEADHRIGETTYRQKIDSILHCFNRDGAILWQFPFPRNSDPHSRGAYTLAAPRLFENKDSVVIFTPMTRIEGANTVHYLLAVNQDGDLIEQQKHASYSPEPITGGTDWGGLWDDIWDFISSPVDFDTSGIPPDDQHPRDVYLKLVNRSAPTVAISVLARQKTPTVVFDDGIRKLAAYHWKQDDLTLVWEQADTNYRYRTSPAILPNGSIVFGQGDGKIAVYNAENGEPLYRPWFNTGHAVVSPIASFGRQLYAAAGDTLTVVDSGNELYARNTPTTGRALGAPALSGNNCYQITTHALYTYSFEGEERAKADGFAGGVSTPAISNDKTIYAVDYEGILWAFNYPVLPLGLLP